MSAVDAYLANISAPQRAELERVRAIVKVAAAGAEEVISYGIPGFKYQKKYLFGYAAFRDHMSIFPTTTPIAAIKPKLGSYEVSKGTIQFTLEHPIPEPIIKELVSIRIRAIQG